MVESELIMDGSVELFKMDKLEVAGDLIVNVKGDAILSEEIVEKVTRNITVDGDLIINVDGNVYLGVDITANGEE